MKGSLQAKEIDTLSTLAKKKKKTATLWAPLTTRSTEVFTASDTLWRTSAAVPGLLNLLVNFRTSVMLPRWLKSTLRVPLWARTCRGTGGYTTARCGSRGRPAAARLEAGLMIAAVMVRTPESVRRVEMVHSRSLPRLHCCWDQRVFNGSREISEARPVPRRGLNGVKKSVFVKKTKI